MSDKIISVVVFVVAAIIIVGGLLLIVWFQYRKISRELKNYERGLKMVRLNINLPPGSTDIEGNGRDQRDLTDEIISQAQSMYGTLASTAKKGFKSKIYGQRHLSFEIVSSNGLIKYYVVTPINMIDVVKQAITTVYASAILQEVRGDNIFNSLGKMTGTIGGEFSLKKEYYYPIATYKDVKQDASRSILRALSEAKADEGVAIQIMIRPASSTWVEKSVKFINDYKGKKKVDDNKGRFLSTGELFEALWKPPGSDSDSQIKEDHQLSTLEQDTVSAVEDKTRSQGFETLVRLVASSSTLARSRSLVEGVVSAFSIFDNPHLNGFEFRYTRNIDQLITSYIMRFFPQSISNNILNTVELASLFHLPSQKDISTSQVIRQSSKQVDGPAAPMNEGLLLGYNEYRGLKKPIRLSTNDRRRHVYFIGQTGTGKSGLLENLAYQDMLGGRGFAFIDPHGDSVEKILGMVPRERIEDVVYFSPGDLERPIGLNLFEFETEDQKDFLVQECIQMLYRLYDPGHTGIVGPRFEHWFRNAALTIMADPDGATFIDIPQVFNDQAFADYKLQFVKDQTVLDFWNKEMAQTTESSKSDVLGWFASKFGAFLSNEMMRNILGQTKSGFDIKKIMNEGKILLVNLSKGKTGELNSMLLGMIFIMKFQVAAMSRASMPENERKDFCLYVDEFQNFATDSFESILSEARKYRLNIIIANQFMTQLTDKIREALIGNVGTMIAGRVGVTDAELLVKKFAPVFEAEDLTRLPNYQTITSVLINNAPSEPFSMNLIPPMGQSNPQLKEALVKFSRIEYGRDRESIDSEIRNRLTMGDRQKKMVINSLQQKKLPAQQNQKSFLDDWLVRRSQLSGSQQNKLTTSIKVSQTQNDLSNVESDFIQSSQQPLSSVHSSVIKSDNKNVHQAVNNKLISPVKQADEIDFRHGGTDKNGTVSLNFRPNDKK